MLGWSINLFRIRGIQLAVHGSFFLLLAWVANEGWKESGLPGLLVSTAALLLFFCCVVLHELGHSFTARHYGIGVSRILLMPIGGMAEFDAIPREPRRELLITAAGPAVNFVIAGLIWIFCPADPATETAALIAGFAVLVMKGNLAMGCFNLLPAFPMDGGRILRASLATRMPYLQATRWAANIGKVVCILGIAISLWVHWWLTAILFAFIAFSGDAEYRAVRRRELEDARWREMLARAYAAPAREEPPLLSP
jgi:Zn-dependent protease